ncbi:MAG: hypothetical protein A2219_03480 [Elusimicrobia bacterium RIFOXYA2_FULL_50_26]|nr:MAG: hypothetical protein A2219_03480 [Elusimicrobia bacterium RIFOXYA2_FULL_50_26]OGS25358.1 MAG: hypothetical protein A2314_06470 [Elusimicrobia bacterium RIFOXYB2_FULL_50_12]
MIMKLHKSRCGGFTMTEAIMSIAIVGILALAIASSKQYLMETQLRSQAESEMQTDATRIMSTLSVAFRKAGDGMPNSSSNLLQVFRDLPSISGSSSIVFFSKDSGTTVSEMDDNDIWTYFGLENGQLVERAQHRRISDGTDTVTVIEEKIMQFSGANERIKTLEFNYFNSGNASDGIQERITDGYAASTVRVYMELEKADIVIKKEYFVLLENLLYGTNF